MLKKIDSFIMDILHSFVQVIIGCIIGSYMLQLMNENHVNSILALVVVTLLYHLFKLILRCSTK